MYLLINGITKHSVKKGIRERPRKIGERRNMPAPKKGGVVK